MFNFMEFFFHERKLLLYFKMIRKKIAWFAGALLGSIFFSPPVLLVVNGINLTLNTNSHLSHENEPSFFLIFEAWLIVGFIWWIFLQILGGLPQLIFSFILAWSSSLLFFSTLSYPVALLVWLIFLTVLFVC